MQERIRGLINPDRLMKPLIADRRITETKRDKFWDHSCARRRTNPCPSLTQIKAPTHPHLQINQRVQPELEPILEPCRFGRGRVLLSAVYLARLGAREGDRAEKTRAKNSARFSYPSLIKSGIGDSNSSIRRPCMSTSKRSSRLGT